ncbi:MAG: hypothetical protein ACE5I5_00880 [Candidatus Heimdallarchaeota archaeon]
MENQDHNTGYGRCWTRVVCDKRMTEKLSPKVAPESSLPGIGSSGHVSCPGRIRRHDRNLRSKLLV